MIFRPQKSCLKAQLWLLQDIPGKRQEQYPPASLKLLKDLCNSEFATLDFKGLPEMNLKGNVF